MAKGDGIIPWKKGQSGNPNGRPKGAVGVKKRFELARKALEMPLKLINPTKFLQLRKKFPKISDGITIDEALFALMIDKALDDKEGELVIKVSKLLRDEAFGRLPEGEEPEKETEPEEKFVFNVTIESEALKSDKIE